MQQIQTLNAEVFKWLNDLPLEKWTMYLDNGHKWGSLTTKVSESYNGVLKKARGLPITAMVRLTVKALIDRFVERSTLANALLEQNKSWPLSVEKRFNENWRKAQAHTGMMNYSTTPAVFEILTFAHNGKGGNVHKNFADAKICSCGKWVNYHIPCSHAIKLCGLCGIEPKTYVSKYYTTKYYKRTYNATFTPVGDEIYWPPVTFSLVANNEYLRTSTNQCTRRRKNEMDIAPARMSRKCSICKETRHTKVRCPRRNPL
ncbi:uncharacterized protein [Solanum tuberosum]|uniref:uncharacterized protein n=1 Tax=Solanum tuberosum TaxID=4113 RepID=UPI00073A433E|nr:PREDICTED: uncharacterized protein LOC107062775 [Solanum tuberosum]